MEENLKPSFTKRILAALIDLVVFFILMIVISNFVLGSILVTNNSDYQTNYQVYEDTLISTKLAVKDDQGVLQIGIYNFDDKNLDQYENNILEFYNSYPDSSAANIEKYQNSKKNYPDLCAYDEETKTYSWKEDTTYAQDFFLYAYNDALNFLYSANKEYATSYQTLTFYLNLNKYLSALISALIPFLILPLILKGQSLGKKIMSLKVCKLPDYQDVKPTDTLLRGIVIALEIVGSYLLYGLPLLISFVMMMATNNRITLHDLLPKTMIISAKYQKTDVIEVESKEKSETNEQTENK